jgi:hypothetical protein
VRKGIEVLVEFGWSLHTRDGYRCTEGVQQHTFLGPILLQYRYFRVLYPHVGIEYVVNKLTNTINQNRSGSLLKMYTCVPGTVPQLYYPGTSLHSLLAIRIKRSHVKIFQALRNF